jgi:integrase
VGRPCKLYSRLTPQDGVSLKLSATVKEPSPMPKSNNRKKKSPKRVLALPDLEHAKTAVLNSLTSASGQRTYEHAIREFVAWYCSEPRLAFNRTVVLRYRIHLEQRAYAPSTINLRLAAVRRIAYEAADAGLLSPELAASIRRVKGVRRIGVRLGNWLTPEQGRRLLEPARPSTLRELRDHAMIAMLIGCGLRRAELLALRLESIQQREDHWVIADLVGKAGHVRTVPIPTWVKGAVDAWTEAANIPSGRVFRAINKAGQVWGDGMSPKVLWDVVRAAAARAGIDKLAPHDLRRTCARLCHLAGGELDQIQFLLGHVSIQTTERYLGCKQKLRIAVNDRLGIEPDAA